MNESSDETIAYLKEEIALLKIDLQILHQENKALKDQLMQVAYDLTILAAPTFLRRKTRGA